MAQLSLEVGSIRGSFNNNRVTSAWPSRAAVFNIALVGTTLEEGGERERIE
jgi:hypothetical protein